MNDGQPTRTLPPKVDYREDKRLKTSQRPSSVLLNLTNSPASPAEAASPDMLSESDTGSESNKNKEKGEGNFGPWSIFSKGKAFSHMKDA